MLNTEADASLVTQALAELAPLGIRGDVRFARDPQAKPTDCLIDLHFGSTTVSYSCEVKRQLRRESIAALRHRERTIGEPFLVVTEHATPVVAEELRSADIQFLDAAGNAYIHDERLLIWISTKRPRSSTRGRARRSSPAALKVQFAVLVRPDLLNAPLRELASASLTSLGTAHQVVTSMIHRESVVEFRHQRRLVDGPKLAKQWAEAYLENLRPRLLLGTFRSLLTNWWNNVDVQKYDALWSGEIAASRMDTWLSPGSATLFVQELPKDLLSHSRLARDKDGDTEFLEKFWNLDAAIERELVPPLLIYADLLARTDARSIDAAQHIFRNHVLRSFDKN